MSRSVADDVQRRRVTPPAAPAPENTAEEADVNTTFVYRGHEDDRPLLWRHPLNELVGALNDLMVKRKKKLGPVLSKAAAANDNGFDPNDDPISDANGPQSRQSTKRSSRRPGSKPRRSGSPRSRPNSGEADDYDDYERPRSGKPASTTRTTPKSRRPERYDPISGALDAAGPYSDDEGEVPRDDIDGRPRPRTNRTQPATGRSGKDTRASGRKPGPKSGRREDEPGDPDDYEEVDDQDEDEDEDEDYEDLGDEQDTADGEIRQDRRPAQGELLRERKAVRRELERVRAQMTADDVLLRMRRQQAAELGNSALECEESIEQARTWIKALEDVLSKRAAKLAEHDARRAKAAQQLTECERALELLEEEERRNSARHVQDQASLANTVKVEQKTHEQWRSLEEELRRLLKEVEGRAGDLQREQLRLTKHAQDLAVGEQEVGKRLAAQRTIAAEIEAEGAALHRYWRRAYLEAEARVGAAAAEVEAEERARGHLVGHGDRIRAKLEGATGNLTAQMTIIEEQGRMDAQLRDATEALERRMREVQLDMDDRERHKAELERQRDEAQSACQDKVEHLNSSLRAIETSANAVATEQAIAQRTLSSSEEALETIEDGEARTRLEEDVDALRKSLAGIEARLREVHRERAAVREMRARTQKDAMAQMARVAADIDAVDRQVEGLLAVRVQLEVEQREVDGKRVVVHSRVKQCRKAVTPLEQERKLYLAELEWVREFEEHSFLRMQEKHEAKVELQERLQTLRDKGSAQLQEQSEDEAVVREGVRALAELKDKVSMHRDHVRRKLDAVQESIAQHEAEAASLSATTQALDGKMAEADLAASDAEERRLAEQAEWESVSLDWKGRHKDWTGRLRREERVLASLDEARSVLQEEVDEVTGQLADQRHAAQNASAQATTLKGEKEALERLIAETGSRLERCAGEEDSLAERLADIKRRIIRGRVGSAYRETLDH